jgi:predicted transcriptional regulator of viral defense system
LENIKPFQRRKAWTQLAEAMADKLGQSERVLVSEYDLFRIVWSIYDQRSAKNLRGAHPSKQTYTRTRSMLRDEGIIRQDNDYSSFWRVMSVPDAPADTVVCQADPHCYISHMSAMQRYGLTNRRPEALFITSPPDITMRALSKRRMVDDFGNAAVDENIYVEPLLVTYHPNRVRRRPVNQLKTKFYGDWRKVRGQEERIASIGQVFLDMLEAPQRCGGMRHVLEVWAENATKYLDQIVKTIDASERPIWKVRAGYILDEYLGISNATILSWQQYAQRGGSRVLESGRDYAEPFSEKWMLSVNVG